MRRIIIVFLFFTVIPPIYGEEINEIYPGNRGFIYSNPEIPEKKSKIKETKPIIIKIAPKEPSKPKVIPKPKKVPKRIEIIKEIPSEAPLDLETKPTEIEKQILEKEIISLKKRLKEATKQLLLANQKIKELKEKTKKPYTTQTYLVQKGDCLWKIAGKKEVYNDPYKWLLLYHANKDQIRNPNLIFPNMVLIVPRLEEYEKKK